ncbi:MAG: hypothetical protein ABIQ60_06895 [Burkholderiaceae bacterium]
MKTSAHKKSASNRLPTPVIFVGLIAALALLLYFTIVVSEARDRGEALREHQRVTGNFGYGNPVGKMRTVAQRLDSNPQLAVAQR